MAEGKAGIVRMRSRQGAVRAMPQGMRARQTALGLPTPLHIPTGHGWTGDTWEPQWCARRHAFTRALLTQAFLVRSRATAAPHEPQVSRRSRSRRPNRRRKARAPCRCRRTLQVPQRRRFRATCRWHQRVNARTLRTVSLRPHWDTRTHSCTHTLRQPTHTQPHTLDHATRTRHTMQIPQPKTVPRCTLSPQCRAPVRRRRRHRTRSHRHVSRATWHTDTRCRV